MVVSHATILVLIEWPNTRVTLEKIREEACHRAIDLADCSFVVMM